MRKRRGPVGRGVSMGVAGVKGGHPYNNYICNNDNNNYSNNSTSQHHDQNYQMWQGVNSSPTLVQGKGKKLDRRFNPR